MNKNLYAKITTICIFIILLPLAAYSIFNSIHGFLEDKDSRQGNGIFEKIEADIDYLNTAFNSNVLEESKFIEVNGLFQRISGKHYIADPAIDKSIVKDNHGLLHFTGFWSSPNNFVQEQLSFIEENVKNLDNYLENKDIPFLLIHAPGKFIEDYTSFPVLINNYANENSCLFLETMQKNDIPIFDLTESICYNEKLPKDNLFYTTDHHWTNPTAFYAYSEIVQNLNENWGFNIDPNNYYRNIDNYYIEKYPKSFVGSQGRRVGKYYSAIDDYYFIYPKFATKYSFSNNGKTVNGDFSSSLVFDKFLQDKDVYTNRYATYLGEDYPLATIVNQQQDQNKVLILKDSFANPISVYLSTCVKEITLLDLRSFEGSVYDFIDDYQPDLVLILYSPSSLSKNMFDFKDILPTEKSDDQ
ncbi:MAG: DHHW family protein [Clostridiales bacterium]